MDERVRSGPVEIVDTKDLAFGIQFTISFPSGRALALTTAAAQDMPDEDLHKLLKRMSKAGDMLDAIYRVRNLRQDLERFERDLATARQQLSNHETKVHERWEASNRKGAVRMSAAEQATSNNFDNSIKHCGEAIKKIKLEIEKAEKEATGA